MDSSQGVGHLIIGGSGKIVVLYIHFRLVGNGHSNGGGAFPLSDS